MLRQQLKVVISTAFVSSEGTVPAPSLARGPGVGAWHPAQLANSSGGHWGRLGVPRSAWRCRYHWWGAAPAWEMPLESQGKGAVTLLELYRLCYFEMVPLGQGSSKSANGNLEGNAHEKRGVREPEGGKHWEKGGWFSFISQIFPASLHVVRTGMLLGENTWTFLRISSSKPRGFFTCGANLSPLT